MSATPLAQARRETPSVRPIPDVPADMLRIARRVVAEHVAEKYLNGQIDDDTLGRRLLALAPHLDEEAAQERFEALVEAVHHRQRVDEGDITVHEVEPCLADPEVLFEQAQTQVEDAVNGLVGGAR